MKFRRLWFRVGLAAVLTLAAIGSLLASQIDHAVDLDGRPANPLAGDSGKVVVLIFVQRDCPVSSRYAPAIQAIGKKYSDTANFWLVFPEKVESPAEIRQYLKNYGYRLPALRDPAHELVRASGVQITPEVAVFDRKHNLVYDGRIDNWYVALGNSRTAATTHELEEAIRAAFDGKPVARSEVRGVGCYISDLQ